jgi:translation initiation factor 2 beta subunit (eIF-2beta)/eIF-5
MLMSSKPSYEEIEYQLAFTYDAYQKKCKECKMLDDKLTVQINEGYNLRDQISEVIEQHLEGE